MRLFLRIGFAYVLAFGFARADDLKWTQLQWNGGPAWTSVCGEVRAIVSESRARLVFLGPEADSSLNFIEAPQTVTREFGSHRVWLGPQTVWGWPPPIDWECSAAQKVEASGATLTVRLPQTDSRYPQLTRIYSWQGKALDCSVSWSGTNTPYYAMQIVQFPASAHCRMRLQKSTTLPAGYVLIENNVTAKAVFTPPTSGFKISDDHADLVSKEPSVKVGFVAQPIIVQEGPWTIQMAPVESKGKQTSNPDFGCLTQIWTGSDVVGYFEAEQFSPYLLPVEGGEASFDIILTASKQ